jgi:hypothetical protein
MLAGSKWSFSMVSMVIYGVCTDQYVQGLFGESAKTEIRWLEYGVWDCSKSGDVSAAVYPVCTKQIGKNIAANDQGNRFGHNGIFFMILTLQEKFSIAVIHVNL